jgi:RNA polymerase sigma-70 factor (ECF subfamily)
MARIYPTMTTTQTLISEVTGPTDECLVALVATGDEHALATLYDRYSRVAFGLAWRILRDHSLAEDAVQEALLAVWRNAASFDPSRATARAWLLTIVHRRAVDIVRRNERLDRPPVLSEPERHEQAAEDEVVTALEAARVRDAVRRLRGREREVLELAYFAGLSQHEIATRIGVPLGTVKSRTFAALSRLRELLEPPGQGAEPPMFVDELVEAFA